jgi:hypothetical protein
VVVRTKQHGDITIETSPHEVHVSRSGEKPGDAAITMLRYSYGEGLPKPDPRATLLAAFADPNTEVVNVGPDLTYLGVMEEHVNVAELRTITLDEARKLALRQGYLMPSDEKYPIRGATTYFSELALDVEGENGTYTIIQYPTLGKPPAVDEVMERFTHRRRMFGEYVVLDIRDPGVNSIHTCYISGVAKFVIAGDHFEDHDLDAIIASFKPLPRSAPTKSDGNHR